MSHLILLGSIGSDLAQAAQVVQADKPVRAGQVVQPVRQDKQEQAVLVVNPAQAENPE